MINRYKFVYKNVESMKKMHSFYDKELDALQFEYCEQYIETEYGKTHILIVGDQNKTPVFTLHGGNGISPLNIKLFLPLLDDYCIIAPDVIGMPGKSAPYRSLNPNREDYGKWIVEILNHLNIKRILFVVSSYSASMMLSLAKVDSKRISKAMLLVPSGIAHGNILPMITEMMIPFIKYYIKPSQKGLTNIVETMISKCDDDWCEFFDLMMSSYKMELRAPKEYTEKDLEKLNAPVLLFASNEDIFFPAKKVFPRAKLIFRGHLETILLEGKHLPDEETMRIVCKKTTVFFNNKI